MSATVIAATMAVSLATVGLFGLAPALSATRSDFGGALRDGTRPGGSQGAARLRRTFVVLQLGMAVMLTVSAGLLLKSFLADAASGHRVGGRVSPDNADHASLSDLSGDPGRGHRGRACGRGAADTPGCDGRGSHYGPAHDRCRQLDQRLPDRPASPGSE